MSTGESDITVSYVLKRSRAASPGRLVVGPAQLLLLAKVLADAVDRLARFIYNRLVGVEEGSGAGGNVGGDTSGTGVLGCGELPRQLL